MKNVLKFSLWILLIFFILLNFVSATNAYKFTHFYEPGEAVAKPEIEKGFWNHAKEKIFGINFIKSRNIQIPEYFSKVVFTTKDKIKLEGWYRSAPNSKGSVALFHGHGSNKSAVLDEANAFIKMGYSVLLTDFRAHGSSEGNTCTIGYREAEDVKLAYDFLKDKGEKNIVLWGISMGAAAISHSIHLYHLQPAKVILEMPFATIEDAVEARLRIMQLPEEPLATLLTFWGGTENGFWAFSMKPEEYVKDIHCPVLLQVGQNDARVTSRETQKIYQNLWQPKALVVYKKSGHQSLCDNEHLNWLASVSAFLNR